MKSRNVTFLVLMCLLITAGVAGVSAQNYKIKQVQSIMGQRVESTVYIKNPRKRTQGVAIMGMGGDVDTIEQCDLKRSVKISDKKKMYYIEPFATPSDDTSAPAPQRTPAPQGKVTKGGTITMTSNISDTGERKQMFGFTARRIKTSMKMEASPDACTNTNMQIETDGWYVDLPQFSCPVSSSYSPPPQYQQPSRSGCQDQIKVRTSGGGKLGFPLQLTTTMSGGEAGKSFSQSIETLELSKATLDDSLFEVPPTYTLATNERDLYGRPDMSAMIKAGREMSETLPTNQQVLGQKPPGVKRIGVLAPTNGTSESISTGELRAKLIQQLGSGNIEAVSISSAADARSSGCDFVLSSSVSRLKQSTAGKIGGFLGKVTNTDTSGSSSWDIQIDFNLTTVDGQSVLSRSVSDKVKGSVEMASSSVLSKEAAAVRSAIR